MLSKLEDLSRAVMITLNKHMPDAFPEASLGIAFVIFSRDPKENGKSYSLFSTVPRPEAVRMLKTAVDGIMNEIGKMN